MANLQWQTKDNPFDSTAENLLNQVKETTAGIVNGDYLSKFQYGSPSVSPEEYFSGQFAEKQMQIQQGFIDRINQAEDETNATKNQYFADKERWLNEKEQMIKSTISNASSNSDYRAGISTTNQVKNTALNGGYNYKNKPSEHIVQKAIEYGSKYGIDPAELLAKAEIESSFNPKAGNRRYRGLFATDYNTYGDKVYDIDFAFDKASKGIKDADKLWRDVGITPTFGHKYLMWQQGNAGSRALWKNRDSGALAKDSIAKFYKDDGRQAIAGNLVKDWGLNADTVTAKEFTDAWVNRGQRAYNKWVNYLNKRG